MVEYLFWIVERLLYYTSVLLHLTYNEINIIVYYGLIPLSWCYMLDRIIEWQVEFSDSFRFMPWLTVGWIVLWAVLVIALNSNFSIWCDWAFDRSVDFLNYFNQWGGNYILNSVVICVLVPLVIYGVLGVLLHFKH